MIYLLTVVKQERNPKYSPCQDAYSRKNEEKEFIINEELLKVALSEEEFKQIKKSMIEVVI